MGKGLSPVVAVVILIAVAVVVGVMVSTWVTHWVSTQTSNTQTCAVNTQYTIDSATFTNSSLQWRARVTNKGSEGIYGFTMMVDNGTYVEKLPVNESPDTSLTSKLKQGDSVYLTSDLIKGANGTLSRTATEIKVTNTGCPSVAATLNTITQA